MEKKCLAILEVSQKQAFIFSSNKLQDNVINSAIIAWVTHPEFFEEVIADRSIYSEEINFAYAGGGHAVLIFDTKEQAKEFVWRITGYIYRTYSGLEMFAKILECGEKIGKEELELLSKELGKKKSNRQTAFHQGSFGIEDRKKKEEKKTVSFDGRIAEMPKREKEIDDELTPEGFRTTKWLEHLGGREGIANFIAVIHIDGNSMGKRVKDFQSSLEGKDWETYRKEFRKFSDSIDKNFKQAYKEMADEVADAIRKEKLAGLELEGEDFPIRRIITAGDDICFITDGRIGLECARIFIEKLVEKGSDQEHYAACAGVAIVHRKYPFYRAYELAEELCSNAKRFIANTYASLHTDTEAARSDSAKEQKKRTMDSAEVCANVCAIDWHIEYGEMKDGLDEIRSGYQTIEKEGEERQHLELRPYILLDPKGLLKGEAFRSYQNFKKLMHQIQTGDIEYARGKLKEFRSYLKEGETAAAHYIKSKRIDDIELFGYQDIFTDMDCSKVGTGSSLERKTFITTADKKKHCLYFDAIELFDLFIPIEIRLTQSH